MNRTEVEQYLKKRSEMPDRFIPTGYPSLDAIIDGYYESNMWVIGGGPGTGKSTLILNLMKKLKKHRISVFDTEMSKYVYMEKFLSCLLKTSHKDMRTNLPSQMDFLMQNMSKLDNYNINIIDKSSPSITDIETEIKTNHPRFLIIDYFQNIEVKNQQFRYIEYTSHVRELERLTKQYNITTILTSQFRKPENGATRPTLFDLKETGKLAEAPAIILLLSRNLEGLSIEVVKNRNGGITGELTLKVDPDKNVMEEYGF